MSKEMLINVSAGEECRIALLEDGKLEELYMERTSNTSHVGNIYKGKVTNVEPSIQAAFVDFGIGRNGFLHISDLMPTYFGKKGEHAPAEKVGQKLGRRDRPPIQQCLRKGDEIVVQIIKEGIGTKGPTLSTYLSIPGRVLVMMPGMSKMGVSKKIEDEEERTRLRKILDGLVPPKDCGFIIRTAGIGKSKLEIEKDLKYLARLWDVLKKQIEKDKPPVELYTEGDLITRTVRDVFTTDVEKIVVDDKDTAKKIKDFIKLAMPRTKNKVELYEDVVPLFHKYELENVVEGIYSRRVPLPSGGSLVIDQTEAIVAIDVNSGKFRDHSDAEETAFRTDLEAADEIPRQLRLRDMGGVIICDFIDLRYERHRRELEERLFENLKNDRAKTRMLRMSGFGIIEMTRQRMRPSLRKAIYHDCQSCNGQGMVKTPESMALDILRKLRIGLNDAAVERAVLTAHPEVALYLSNKKRYEIAKLEQVTEKQVAIAADADMAMDDTKFELYDSRDGYVYIAELGMVLPTAHHGRQDNNRGPRRDDRRRNEQPAKAKHDRREDETIVTEDAFAEDSEDGKAKSKEKPAKAARGAKPAKGEPVDEIEQTGNDDEASVVDVDEGGDSGPGNAPGGFFDPSERRYGDRDRDRRGGRRGGNGNRNRGRDDRPPRPDRSATQPRDDRRDEQPRDERPGNEAPAEIAEDANEDAPELDTAGEDAGVEQNDAGPVEGQVGPDGEPPREGGRRRRRRRGRRGRGRGAGEEGAPQGESQQPVADGAPIADRPPQREPQDRGNQPPREQQDRGNQPPRQNDRGDQQGRRNNGRGNDQGRRGNDQNRRRDQQGPNRRGSERVDLSHVAREAARQDAGYDAGQDVVEDEHATPGNDINYVPKAKPEPAGRVRGGRRQRGGRTGRVQATARRTPPIEGLPNDEELDREAAELEAKLAKANKPATPKATRGKSTPPAPIEVPDVAPTGSSDSHLVDDEPADGEEVRPPSSFTDLDALPDYDDD